MKQFRYRVLDDTGNKVSGYLIAETYEKAKFQLQDRGWLILSIHEGTSLSLEANNLFTHYPLSNDQLVRFTQQLATLLNAGQHLEKALSLLIKQPINSNSQKLISRLRDKIKSGYALSTAMAEEGGQFSNFYISLVVAGEASGALATTLTQLAEYLERSQLLRTNIINALIYPAFLILGVVGATVLLLIYVIPQFSPVFKDMGIPLPTVTAFLFDTSNFLTDYGMFIVAGLIIVVAVIFFNLKNEKLSAKYDFWILRAKLIGQLLQHIEMAKFSRMLGTLLFQGVSLLTALNIAKQVTTNKAVQLSIESACEQVKAGKSLSITLANSKVFPDLAIQMIQVGEESGSLDKILLKLADIYDDETKHSFARLLASLVPALTLLMSALVALIMMAIMLPLMNLTNGI